MLESEIKQAVKQGKGQQLRNENKIYPNGQEQEST